MLFLLKCLASGSLFFHPAQEKVILVTAVSPSQALSDNAPHPTSSQPLGLCVFQQAISEVGPLGWRDRNAPQWEATDGSVALLKLTALPVPLAFLHLSTYTQLHEVQRYFLLMTEYIPCRDVVKRYQLCCQGQAGKEPNVGHCISGEAVSTS